MKKFVSLRVKLIRLMLILITLPVMVSATITHNEFIKRVEQNASNYSAQLLQQVNLNLERYIKEIERLTLTPLYDPEILSILKKHGSINLTDEPKFLTTEESLKMSFFLTSFLYDRSEVRSILLFTNDGIIFNNSEYSISNKWTEATSLWMKDVVDANGMLVIIPPHIPTYYLTEQERVVSIARTIREPYTHKILGIMKIDLKEEGIKKILYPIGKSHESEFYIFNTDKLSIYPFNSPLEIEPNSNKTKINGEEYSVLSIFSKNTNLSVYNLIPYKNLKKDATEITSVTVIISLFSLIFAIVLLVFFSKSLITPLKHLQGKMRNVKNGILETTNEAQPNDEIGELCDGFNRMILEINKLDKVVYQVKLRERDALIISLQNQINPHFLYNTLEVINMIALKEKQMELSDTVISLSRLLRYTVSNSDKPVRLSSEIEFIENYLHIQALRLKDKFTSEINIDMALEDCLVPKLILQPFVENIIEHAMGDEPIHIRVKSTVQWEDIIVIIQDDGKGISDEQIKVIEDKMYCDLKENDSIEEYGLSRKGYALRNVHQRIYLLYGYPYGVSIDRKIDHKIEKGATFFVRLPLIWEVGENV